MLGVLLRGGGGGSICWACYYVVGGDVRYAGRVITCEGVGCDMLGVLLRGRGGVRYAGRVITWEGVGCDMLGVLLRGRGWGAR